MVEISGMEALSVTVWLPLTQRSKKHGHLGNSLQYYAAVLTSCNFVHREAQIYVEFSVYMKKVSPFKRFSWVVVRRKIFRGARPRNFVQRHMLSLAV